MNTPSLTTLAVSVIFAAALGCKAQQSARGPTYAPAAPFLCDERPELCIDAPPDGPIAEVGLVCCTAAGCVAIASNDACGPEGDVYSCPWGQSNPDGTVTCYN